MADRGAASIRAYTKVAIRRKGSEPVYIGRRRFIWPDC